MDISDYARIVNTPTRDFLSHQAPMRLLQEVRAAGLGSAVCRCDVSEANPFSCPPNGVPSWVGIEFMAQCVAVSAGIEACVGGRPAPLGLLLGTMAYYSAIEWFDPSMEYLAHCTRMRGGDKSIGAFDCSLSTGGETIASARLTVMELPGTE